MLLARQVWCNVHTGLGPCGVDVLLGSGLDAAELSLMFPRVPAECDGHQCLEEESLGAVMERRCAKSPDLTGLGEGTAQSAGYEYTVGVIRNGFFTPCFQLDSGRILCFTQERGTLRIPDVMRSLILETTGRIMSSGGLCRAMPFISERRTGSSAC